MKKPTLSVILLTCNRLGVTKKTLKYLLATTHINYELLIVHNYNKTKGADKVRQFVMDCKPRSPDGSLKRVVKILNKHNRGVAGGRNDGIHRSEGLHKVYLDDDVLAPDMWAEAMLEVIEKVPEIATVGVSVEKQDFKIVTKNGVTFQRKNGNIGGAFVLIPDRTFKRLGYLCEDYGPYGLEDADLYQRVSAIGQHNAYIHPMKGQHIDPENDPEYRKFKNSIYKKGSRMMCRFTANNQKYKKKEGLYIPYKPKI